MTLAEYLAEVRALPAAAGSPHCSTVDCGPCTYCDEFISTRESTLLAIIEEQARALDMIRETPSKFRNEPAAREIASEAQARIDALIAKGET